MPKNEHGEVTCLNHPEVKIELQKDTAVMQTLIFTEGESPTPDANGYPIDVYICKECQYMELYARVQNSTAAN